MRERSTWNRESVLKRAAVQKQADPYTMNQEHPQPASDKYVNGNPSQWAEDVHKPDDWKVEYSGGEVKRNEIGLPEMRPETFTHKEKTASEQLMVKKADLCVNLAKAVLRKASESVIEDQAVAFMELSDASLIDTYNRVANQDQGQEQAPAQDEKQAQQEQSTQEAAPAQDEKSAGATLAEAFASPEFKAVFAKLFKQAQDQAQQTQQTQQAPAQEEAKQAAPVAPIAAPVAQAPVAQQQQEQMMPPPAQQEMQADDQLLEDLLAGPDMMPQADVGMVDDIQMGDSSGMDFDDTGLGPEDADLQMLFAQDPEAQDALQAQGQQAKQAAVRTASTRTIGTKPTVGVSRIGLPTNSKTAGSEDKLSALWPSAPDVREHFGQR